MTLQNKAKKVRDALLTVSSSDVYHYSRPSSKDLQRFVVWKEDYVGEIYGDGSEQRLDGYIDLYTSKEFDPWVDEIEDACRKAHVLIELQGVQKGDPVNSSDNLIHYTWHWAVM